MIGARKDPNLKLPFKTVDQLKKINSKLASSGFDNIKVLNSIAVEEFEICTSHFVNPYVLLFVKPCDRYADLLQILCFYVSGKLDFEYVLSFSHVLNKVISHYLMNDHVLHELTHFAVLLILFF